MLNEMGRESWARLDSSTSEGPGHVAHGGQRRNGQEERRDTVGHADPALGLHHAPGRKARAPCHAGQQTGWAVRGLWSLLFALGSLVSLLSL